MNAPILKGVSIRKPRIEDLRQYTDLFQRTYQTAYVNEAIGLTTRHLSPAVFNSADTQKYLLSRLLETASQRVWLAWRESDLIGAITVEDKGDECEILAFYVAPEFQGRGIGRVLWDKAVVFCGSKDIIVDLYAHNEKTIAMYRKWGFEIDAKKGENGVFYRHWPEWPDDLQVKAYYMRRKGVS
ncbi:MAG: GNAT family N-acetyltransferase [Alphaproteobacteria bacterium]|nr:GNAT family N-acetyltransferase [Alphaproteobacteria bacterium]